MPDDKKSLRDLMAAQQEGEAPPAPAPASPAPAQTAQVDTTFDSTRGKLAEGTAAQPPPPASPAASGAKETAPGETAHVESDAVRIKQMELENAARMKALDIALGLWKEHRDDQRSLRDRELSFADWQRKNAISRRDTLMEKLSGARDIKWSYHGTFANGVLTSSWSGTATNPYKDVLRRLGEEADGGNPYAAFREAERDRGFDMPDWLKAILPNGEASQRKPPPKELNGATPNGGQSTRGSSTVTAYRENRPLADFQRTGGDYLRAGRTSTLVPGRPESLTRFREERARVGDRTFTSRRERTTFGVPVLEGIR